MRNKVSKFIRNVLSAITIAIIATFGFVASLAVIVIIVAIDIFMKIAPIVGAGLIVYFIIR